MSGPDRYTSNVEHFSTYRWLGLIYQTCSGESVYRKTADGTSVLGSYNCLADSSVSASLSQKFFAALHTFRAPVPMLCFGVRPVSHLLQRVIQLHLLSACHFG